KPTIGCCCTAAMCVSRGGRAARSASLRICASIRTRQPHPRVMPVFADQSREQLRQMYLSAWRKFRAQKPLQPLEAQIAAGIPQPPEYIEWLEHGEALRAEFTPAGGRENPFLHLGLHLAIREQVATDRPAGIAAAHRSLCNKFGDAHAAEHAMLTPL